MIFYKESLRIERKIDSIKCDICKKTYDDEMELEEFLNIDFVGGYLSIFGDEENFECNICQYCLKEKLGDFIRKVEHPVSSDVPYIEKHTFNSELLYNKDYGDDRMCICGHPYYRHFDPFYDNIAIGCKFCSCDKFEEFIDEN